VLGHLHSLLVEELRKLCLIIYMRNKLLWVLLLAPVCHSAFSLELFEGTSIDIEAGKCVVLEAGSNTGRLIVGESILLPPVRNTTKGLMGQIYLNGPMTMSYQYGPYNYGTFITRLNTQTKHTEIIPFGSPNVVVSIPTGQRISICGWLGPISTDGYDHYISLTINGKLFNFFKLPIELSGPVLVTFPSRRAYDGGETIQETAYAYSWELNAESETDTLANIAANKISSSPASYGIATQSGLSSAIAPLATKAELTSALTESRTAGVNSVLSNPNLWTLYTTSQIQNMAVGDLVLTRQVNGGFVLNYDIEQSTDLQTWTPYQALSLPLTGLPTDKAFVRIKVKQ
jgi:hypothetical protein